MGIPDNPAKITEEQREDLLVDPEFVVAKDWTDEEKTHFVDKGWRPIREGEVPRVSVVVRPTDYEHDLKRGTVVYNPNFRNYASHNVIIPDGSFIRNSNFAQAEPNTDCITGENLTLIDCNLNNVALHPSWTVQNCLTVQSWIVLEDGVETRQYICAHPSLLGVVVKPIDAITTKDF